MRMALREQLKANFHSHGGAFDRLRDRLGIKSATAKSRELFSILYQASVDQIVSQMLVEADYLRKRTLTMDMAQHAYLRVMGKKIYPVNYGARRVPKHSQSSKPNAEAEELGVSRSLKPEAAAEPEPESEAEAQSEADDADLPEA